MNKKVKVGILLSKWEVDYWEYTLIKGILDADFAEVVLVVFEVPKTEAGTETGAFSGGWIYKTYGLIKRILKAPFKPHFLYHLYCFSRIEDFIKKRLRKPNAFEKVSIKDILENVPIINVTPERSLKFSDYIADADCKLIMQYQPDMLLRLAFRILRGGILTAPPCGIWSFHHADNSINRGGPPAIWEILLNQRVSGITLQIITESLDGGQVLERVFLTTNAPFAIRNYNKLLMNSTPVLLRQLRNLSTLGNKAFMERVRQCNPIRFYSKPLYRSPTNGAMAIGVIRAYGSFIWKKYFESWVEKKQWFLLYKIQNSVATSFYQFKEIVPPSDRFWADPFVVHKDGLYYVFFEEVTFSDNKGRISMLTIDENGNVSDAMPVLDLDQHLSYPSIIEHGGYYYMLPETNQTKMELFRCESFPDRWEPCAVLFDKTPFADPSLYFHDGYWWLFVTELVNYTGIGDTLSVYYRKELLSGEWTPHPMNPVVCDPRNARSAGQIFLHDGRIYRPSQDCSEHYGYGITLNEIVTLNSEVYHERVISRATPDWRKGLVSCHTFNFCGKLTIIDAERIKYFKR
ncbi:MAG: hypothetical protein HQL64_09280 [Magnetococcales bacterium]|nr:hypothetical protein [Magnetococcales bacterium]